MLNKTKHAFVHDKIDPVICNAWNQVDSKLATMTTPKMQNARGPMEQDTVTCVAARPFFTEKSTFKIGVGDVLTWRVGFNSWVNTNEV